MLRDKEWREVDSVMYKRERFTYQKMISLGQK